MDVGGVDLEDVQQAIPVAAQAREGLVGLAGLEALRDRRLYQTFIDGLRAGRVELLVLGILVVTEEEDDLTGFARLELDVDLMGADGRPAVSDGARKLADLDGGRPVPSAIGTEEGVATGLKSGGLLRAGKVGEVVAAFAILGLVIDDAVLHLDLAGIEVALKVGGVVLRVPEAKLDVGEDGDARLCGPEIRDCGLPDLKVLVERDEIARVRADALVIGADDRVTQAVTARIVARLVARGLPGRRPEAARFAVAEVDVAPARIHGHVVVAVPAEAAQLGVAIKRVAAGGVGDDPEVILASQIVDPRQWCVGPRNDVFAALVVEGPEFHSFLLFQAWPGWMKPPEGSMLRRLNVFVEQSSLTTGAR
jgi:hypothetical protein